MNGNGLQQGIASGLSSKWFSSPVTSREEKLDEVRVHIPSFERRAFGLPQPQKELSRLNERLDMIVRLPFGKDDTFVPIGVVSKEYMLIQHTEVLDFAIMALQEAKIELSDMKVELEMTEYGERMHLSLYLPEKYNFNSGDGHPMCLRLECINSVDGSTRFRALMGWFRFVCSNGLVIGITGYDIRRRHLGDLGLEDFSEVLSRGLSDAETEKSNFESWRKKEVSHAKIVSWIDKELRAAWGLKAAARAYHIALSGFDGEVVGSYKEMKPSSIGFERTKLVPGAPKKSCNLFDLSQVLAWLARERRDLQEQLEWREKIPDLMAHLMN